MFMLLLLVLETDGNVSNEPVLNKINTGIYK